MLIFIKINEEQQNRNTSTKNNIVYTYSLFFNLPMRSRSYIKPTNKNGNF